MLAGRVADELVQASHRSRIQPGNAAVIGHTQKHRATATVGHGRQLGGHAIGIGGVALELVAAVFTTRQCLQEFGFSHAISPL